MKEDDYLDENIHLIERFKQIPSLQFLDKKDIAWMVPLSKIKEYDAGEFIINEGESDKSIYFLLSGKVSVLKNEVALSMLCRLGDVFGLMALIENQERAVSVRAISETLCLKVEVASMDNLDENEKTICMYLLYRLFANELATRLRDTSNDLKKANKEITRLKT